MKYDHTNDDVNEAVGIDRKALNKKVRELIHQDLDQRSQEVEQLEKTFSKRELAFMAGMFLATIKDKVLNKKTGSKSFSEGIPEHVKEALMEALKESGLPFNTSDIQEIGVMRMKMPKRKKPLSEGGDA